MESAFVTSADSVQLPVPANAVPWQQNSTAVPTNTTCADYVSLHIACQSLIVAACHDSGRAQSTAVPLDN